MINLSIQKLHSLSCPAPVPLRIEEDPRRGETETKQNPVGPSQEQKASPCPPFLVCRKQGVVSWAFPEFQRADSSS